MFLSYLKNTLILGLIIVFYSCSLNKVHNHFKFAKTNFNLVDTTLLKTNGVYLLITTTDSFYVKDELSKKIFRKDLMFTDGAPNRDGQTQFPFYHFLRFYPNGRCFCSYYFLGKINQDTLLSSSTIQGEQTFYRLKDSLITIEYWANYEDRYCFDYGVIRGNKIYITSTKTHNMDGPAIKNDPPIIFEFKKMDLNHKASW